MRIVTIHPAGQPDVSQPHPFHIEPDGSVRYQEFWKGNPTKLWGFQERFDVRRIDLRVEDWLAGDIQQAQGMYPVFSYAYTKIAVHQIAIESVTETTVNEDGRSIP